mmetsp:Transcript_17332/g.32288  ORF Transcript_17332/g.32288 Transcript_17332/m.32288 type:complete len:83 (-) Transcript_17332:146-394(-)
MGVIVKLLSQGNHKLPSPPHRDADENGGSRRCPSSPPLLGSNESSGNGSGDTKRCVGGREKEAKLSQGKPQYRQEGTMEGGP